MNDLDLVSEEDTLIKRIVSLCQKAGRRLKIEGHCPALSGGRPGGVYQGRRGRRPYPADPVVGSGKRRIWACFWSFRPNP